MTERSSDSTPSTRGMTPSTSDTINVLPTLSEAKAPVSLTLTIDKSVSKIAGWVIGALMGMTLISGISATVTVMTVMNSSARERDVNNKLQISENHWRDIEVKVKSLEAMNNDSRR